MSGNFQTFLNVVSIVIGVFLIVAIGSSILIFASHTGWNELAQHFRAVTRPNGDEVHYQRAVVGLSILNVSAITTDEGLYLKPLQWFHPALLIPWSAFYNLTWKSSFLQTNYTMEVQIPQGNKRLILVLTKAVGEKVHQHLNTANKSD